MLLTRRAVLARFNGTTKAEEIASFATPWLAVAYAEQECPGGRNFDRRLCIELAGVVYPFVVREDGESVFRGDVYEALLVVCPR